MSKRKNRPAMTPRQAAEAIQRTSVNEFATEEMAQARTQNQMSAAPGNRAAQDAE